MDVFATIPRREVVLEPFLHMTVLVLPNPDPNGLWTKDGLRLMEAVEAAVVDGQQGTPFADHLNDQPVILQRVLGIPDDRLDELLEGPPVAELFAAFGLRVEHLLTLYQVFVAIRAAQSFGPPSLRRNLRRNAHGRILVKHPLYKVLELLALGWPRLWHSAKDILDGPAQRENVCFHGFGPERVLDELRRQIARSVQASPRGLGCRCGPTILVFGRLEVAKTRGLLQLVPKPVGGLQVTMDHTVGVDVRHGLRHGVCDPAWHPIIDQTGLCWLTEVMGHAARSLQLLEKLCQIAGVAVELKEATMVIKIQESSAKWHNQGMPQPSVEHDLLDKAGKSAAGMQVKDFDHAWRVLQRHLVDRMPASLT